MLLELLRADTAVQGGVALIAKRNEIVFCVLARVAAKPLVMHFEVRH